MRNDSSDSPSRTAGRARRYILVVTGSSDNLYRTSLLLQQFAYPVCTAQTAKQALDIIAVALPALVITDLVLPDMSGLEMLRKVACDARSLPVILLLAGADALVESRRVEIGGSVLSLAKPLPAEDLYRAVQSVIEDTPRSSLRIPTTLPATVNRASLNADKGEYVMNLSENGVFVRMLKPPRPDERVSIELNINGSDVKADAVVLHSHRPGEGPLREPGMAVRFTAIAPENREVIRKFIHDEVTRGIVAHRK